MSPRALVDLPRLPLLERLALVGPRRIAAMESLRRRHGDLFATRYRDAMVVHVIHPDDAQALLGQAQGQLRKGGTSYRVMRAVIGDGLITSNGELWRRQRRLVQPMVSARACAELLPAFEATARRVVGGMAEGVHDLGRLMVDLTVRQAMSGLFGAAGGDEDVATIDRAMAHLMATFVRHVRLPIPLWLPLPSHLRLRRDAARLDEVLARLVARTAPAGDGRPPTVVAHLLRAHLDGALSRAQLRDEIMTMLLAGYETTATAMTWTLYLLASHRDVQERVHDEVRGAGDGERVEPERLVATRQVIAEALRLYPPVPLLLREVERELPFAGRSLGPGTLLVFWVYLTHRHPAFWEDPGSFRPERFAEEARHPYAYLPFGGGPRRCIGRDFALLEMAVNVALLVRRFRIELEPGPPARTVPGVTLRPDRPIRARLRLRPGSA